MNLCLSNIMIIGYIYFKNQRIYLDKPLNYIHLYLKSIVN